MPRHTETGESPRDHIAGRNPDDLVFAGIRNGQPLRHAVASLAIASGADVKVVQQMLGHSSATMTLDTYGHLARAESALLGIQMEA